MNIESFVLMGKTRSFQSLSENLKMKRGSSSFQQPIRNSQLKNKYVQLRDKSHYARLQTLIASLDLKIKSSKMSYSLSKDR